MKKLMVAAACAAMAVGAFAGACDDVTYSEELDGCLVYDVQFKMQTLSAKKLTCKGCSKCDEKSYIAYLDKKTRKLNGYMWFCADNCWTKDDTPYLVLWEKATKTVFAPLPYTVENNAKKIYWEGVETAEFSFLGRYGKKANKVAASWENDGLDGVIYKKAADQVDAGTFSFKAAGLNGKGLKMKDECDEGKSLTLKSISGNAAGTFSVTSLTTKSECDDAELGAIYVDFCECFTDYCDDCGTFADADDVVPASGTWSIKYNKKLSKSAKSMLLIVPAWAQFKE